MKIVNKSTIEIKFKFKNELSKFGFGKIWMGDDFLGTENDLIPLNYLVNILEQFRDSKEVEENLKNLNNVNLFEYLKKDKTELSDKYLVRGSTFTDDFHIFSYKRNGEIFILWKILNTNFFEDLKEYKTDLIEKKIDFDELIKIINKLKKDYR